MAKGILRMAGYIFEVEKPHPHEAVYKQFGGEYMAIISVVQAL